jgi:hypothetical protein
MPPRSCLTGLHAKAWGLTLVEQDRIRLNAPRINANLLGKLMGRSPGTLTTWAKANGVTFVRAPWRRHRPYPDQRKPVAGVRVLPVAYRWENRIDRMMRTMDALDKLSRAS